MNIRKLNRKEQLTRVDKTILSEIFMYIREYNIFSKELYDEQLNNLSDDEINEQLKELKDFENLLTYELATVYGNIDVLNERKKQNEQCRNI